MRVFDALWLRRTGTHASEFPAARWVPALRPGHETGSSRGADHLGDLVDDFADLVLADDQRRGQRQRIAGNPQHQIVVVEGAVQPDETALARQVRDRGEVDAGGEADGADIYYTRLFLQRHDRVGEFRF